MVEAKESMFVETFGDTPWLKVLDFFLTFRGFDYSKTQVARETGVSRVTIEKIWKDLIKEKMIVKTRKIGRAEMYKLNEENPKVKILTELGLKLASAYAEEEIEKTKIKETVKAK